MPPLHPEKPASRQLFLTICYYMPCTINTCMSKINILISVRELSRTRGLRFNFFRVL